MCRPMSGIEICSSIRRLDVGVKGDRCGTRYDVSRYVNPLFVERQDVIVTLPACILFLLRMAEA
jgi:hypothetical protein